MARLLVIDFDDRAVGYVNLGASRRVRGEQTTHPWGEVFELYLLPEYQGLGLGQTLFDAAAAELRSARYQNLIVWCLRENERGLNFYHACGGKAFARSHELFGGLQMPTVGFSWKL